MHEATPIARADPGGRAPSPWRRARSVAAGTLFLAFDGAMILPLCAELYLLKRSVNLDVFRGVDTLPDPLIEATLHGILRAIGLH